jgi:endonuclease-3
MTDYDSSVRRRARTILKYLNQEYLDVETALNHRTPLQLVVATILSAQCTDARVNKVTQKLFKKYRNVDDYADAKPEELEKDIQSTGFFRNKAKNIKHCCQQLKSEHGGHVPDTMEELVQLAGVGRKTANVVLGTAFGKALGVVVDTHVSRLSQRMGLTTFRDPVRIERDLMQLLPRNQWITFSHQMISHGRRVCPARRPKCEICYLRKTCPKVGVETKS